MNCRRREEKAGRSRFSFFFFFCSFFFSFSLFSKELLGINEKQIVWTSDHEPSVVIDDTRTPATEAIEAMLADRSQGHGYMLLARDYTSNVSKWVAGLNNPRLMAFGRDYPGLIECSSAMLFRHAGHLQVRLVLFYSSLPQ